MVGVLTAGLFGAKITSENVPLPALCSILSLYDEQREESTFLQKIWAILVHQAEFNSDFWATMHNVAGQLAPTSRKTYLHDARHFAGWMSEHARSLQVLSRDDLVAYRAYLGETYAKATAARMWTVVGRLLDETIRRQVLLSNPAEGIRGFKAGDDESPHRALKREEARALLEAIDRSTALGKRDYALIMLLLRTVIRLAEAAALTFGDLTMEQG